MNYGIRYDLTLIPPYGTKDTIDKQGGIETGDFDFSNGTYVLQHPPPPCTVRGHAPCIPSIMLDAQGNAVACDPATQPCLPAGTLPPHVVVDPRGRISPQHLHQSRSSPWFCVSGDREDGGARRSRDCI